MPDLRALIRTERLALIDLLRTLTPQEWSTPSLCDGWTVQDVAAHLAFAPKIPLHEMATGLARAGLRVNKFNADAARRWSHRGTTAILDQLSDNAATDAKPLGVPRRAALVDSVVHALDVRRPLGKSRTIPDEAFEVAADFCASPPWPAGTMLGGSVGKRLDGVRLVATDADWSFGEGAEVRASKDALMLVLTGRPLGPEELSGPGAAVLSTRL